MAMMLADNLTDGAQFFAYGEVWSNFPNNFPCFFTDDCHDVCFTRIPDNIIWMEAFISHHDYQREGNPVGYYVPGMECKTDSGNTLILCHEDIYNKRISDKRLLDDVFVEVDWEGNIVWEWHVSQHFNELGFT